jgi:CelD/BcsL family acetyltransferase involved in cellulose biosynthesis
MPDRNPNPEAIPKGKSAAHLRAHGLEFEVLPGPGRPCHCGHERLVCRLRNSCPTEIFLSLSIGSITASPKSVGEIQPLRVVLLREIPEDANLRRQWNELALHEQSPQVFYTYEWAIAVLRAYDHVLEPLIFLGYDEAGSLLALAALAREKAGNRVSFLCATTGDYCDFLASPKEKSEFIASVFVDLAKEGFTHITLTNLPADSGTAEVLSSLSRKFGYHAFARTAYDCAQISLTNLRTISAEGRSLPGARRLRRATNLLQRQTTVAFEHARGPSELESGLPEFIQTHIARFLATGRISNLARPERQTFLKELAKLLSDSGWLVLSRMSAGDHNVAWSYGFAFAGTWFWYQPTFDSDFEKHSPGFCLLAKIVEDAFALPEFHTLDLGLGAEEYKDSFANQSRRTIYLTLRASVAEHAREILRYRVSQVARLSPPVERTLRSAVQYGKDNGVRRTIRNVFGQLTRTVYSETEVFFYEATGPVSPHQARLVPLDLNTLARAVMQYVDDKSTCEYLLRCAQRLRQTSVEGYASIAADGSFLHFVWATDFDGFFLSELRHKVDAPSPDCVMLFDCWTPLAQRGHGYYGQAISALAELLRHRGKQVWIFSAANNQSSVGGLAKAGFEPRYALVSRRILGWQRVQKHVPAASGLLQREASVGV